MGLDSRLAIPRRFWWVLVDRKPGMKLKIDRGKLLPKSWNEGMDRMAPTFGFTSRLGMPWDAGEKNGAKMTNRFHRSPEASQDTTSWTQTLGCLAWGGLAKQLEANAGIPKISNQCREIIGLRYWFDDSLTALSFSFHYLGSPAPQHKFLWCSSLSAAFFPKIRVVTSCRQEMKFYACISCHGFSWILSLKRDNSVSIWAGSSIKLKLVLLLKGLLFATPCWDRRVPKLHVQNWTQHRQIVFHSFSIMNHAM